ncbi:MAG: trypsin-like peptidase domain-containing protein [Verrucomicrobiota bacterium]|nr:trypsin-like peptidase domain-containing protein [Verrucomicrobiota bacterium]
MFALLLSAAEPEKSVIQIMTFSQQPDWDEPWNARQVRRSTGSGFVIKGNRIMTNAHVVSWAKQIQVRRFQDSRPHIAQVAFVGHDCDIAILTVDDATFFEGLEPLPIGVLPEVRSVVNTIGYPAGGEQISYTSGVVSRIEIINYVQPGNRSLLAVQTDAAINPGNSGGPVIQDGKVVGVAFQGTPGLENTGFFIPPPVIQHFLKDVEDGSYHGFPQAGIRLAPLINPAFRDFLKLTDPTRGARIDTLTSDSAKAFFKEDDVLLEANGYPVAADATILYEGNQVNGGIAFSQAQHGAKVPVKVWRDGKELAIDLPVHVNTKDRLEGNQYAPPRYYVYAGLVFTPLSRDYLATFGQNWSAVAGIGLLYELFYRKNTEPDTARSEPVMLSTLLAHEVNANMEIKGRVLVDSINGKRIDSLADAIGAIESHEGSHHLIEFGERLGFECLDREAADLANEGILKTYGIQSDRQL